MKGVISGTRGVISLESRMITRERGEERSDKWRMR